MDETRTCRYCNTTRPIDEFQRNKNYPDGRTFKCKPCARAYSREWDHANPDKARARRARHHTNRPDDVLRTHRTYVLRKKYGITMDDYDRLLEEQGGHCAICPATEPGSARRKFLYVDHDHETGRVRGLLCASCNDGLGRFRDDPGLLHSAIAYLQKIEGTTGRTIEALP